MRPSRVLYGVAALLLVLSSPAKGTEFNKLTYITFSAPLQIPGLLSLPERTGSNWQTHSWTVPFWRSQTRAAPSATPCS